MRGYYLGGNVSPLALTWTVWKEKDRRVFNGIEKDVVHLQSCLLTSWWCIHEVPICLEV